MKIRKRIYIIVFLILLASTALLMSTVLNLRGQRKVRLETISQLTRNIAHLEKKIDHYEKEKKKVEFYQFAENVYNLKYPNFSQVARIVFEKSKEYGFNPYLIMAVIQVESDFQQFAVSSHGAYGLMQVNYAVWKDVFDIDFNRIFEKRYNIDLGLKILKHYFEKASGNIFRALFHYNNGYKYNNEEYNDKITGTKFFTQIQVPRVDQNLEKDVSM